jgi:ABC-2 type transport system permease protein
MRAWKAAIGVGFRHTLAYRAEVLIQLFSAAIVAGLNGSIWTAAVRGRAQIGGIPADQLHSYVIVAWTAVSFYATRVNEDIGRRFRDGQIASDLLRPMEFQAFWYARDLGRALASFGVQTLPLLAGGWLVFGFPLPTSPWTWLLWMLSLLLGHACSFGLAFLVGIASVRLRSTTGLSHVKSVLVSVFSGALIPLELFGPGWQPLVQALPFRAMAQVPTHLFLEQEAQPVQALGLQAAWAVALWGLGAWGWRSVQRRLVIQGG